MEEEHSDITESDIEITSSFLKFWVQIPAHVTKNSNTEQ